MKYSLFFLMLVTALCTMAQDCSKELLRKKPGNWKAGPQGSINNIAAADLVKEKAVLASIHKMLNTNYKPTGCQVSYSTVFSKYPGAGQTWLADPYHFAMIILPYLCNNKSTDISKYTVSIASATSVDIMANEIDGNIYAATLPIEERGYIKLKQRPQKREDVWFMGEEKSAGDNEISTEILITYNDTLPFYYVSRKEYLQILLKRLDKAKKESPGETAYFNTFIKNVNDYLKKPETELSQPAICMWNDEERFERFVDEGTKGSFITIKPNLDYYHKKLPKSSPQFFTVVYHMSIGEAVFEENIANIKKAVDFTALKNMLGK